MLKVESLDFLLEEKSKRKQNETPTLSVSHRNACLNMAFSVKLDLTKPLFYQIGKVGKQYYLITGDYEFTKHTYKAAININKKTGNLISLLLGSAQLREILGPKKAGDILRYDLLPVPMEGKTTAFELILRTK